MTVRADPLARRRFEVPAAKAIRAVNRATRRQPDRFTRFLGSLVCFGECALRCCHNTSEASLARLGRQGQRWRKRLRFFGGRRSAAREGGSAQNPQGRCLVARRGEAPGGRPYCEITCAVLPISAGGRSSARTRRGLSAVAIARFRRRRAIQNQLRPSIRRFRYSVPKNKFSILEAALRIARSSFREHAFGSECPNRGVLLELRRTCPPYAGNGRLGSSAFRAQSSVSASKSRNGLRSE